MSRWRLYALGLRDCHDDPAPQSPSRDVRLAARCQPALAGEIYPRAELLTLSHIKPRLLGHWSTTPGRNLR